MFSSTQPVSFEYLPDHLVSQAARSRRASGRLRRCPGSGFAGPRTGSQPTQLLQAVIVNPARHVVERVAQKMHVAALVGRLRRYLAQRCPQAGMIVGHDKLHAVQTARLEPEQKITPARSALAVGELDRQHLAAVVPNRYRSRINTAWLAITPASRTRS
jgi:hypothetical protein